MKKSILKNLLALTFALGALVFVAGNVYADEEIYDSIDNEFINWPKRCMLPSGSLLALVYGCESNPGTIPPQKCSGITWFRTGSRIADCSK